MKNNVLKNMKKNNIIKILYKSISENISKQKLIQFNGFNIIELSEDDNDNNTINEFDSISEREITRLKNIAYKVESYFLNNEKNINEDGICFKCRIKYLNGNDLLYFVNRKDLLNYLKYCFYFLKKIIFINHQNYINNKYELEKCNKNYLNNWKFFIPKAMCKICFMNVININNLFGNLKTIFCDIDNIDLVKRTRNYSSFIKRKHNRNKSQISSIKINTNNNNNNNTNDNKIENKNVLINNNYNIILINKSILKDIDFSSFSKIQNEKKKEVQKINKEKEQNNNITNTFNTYNIINNYQINNQISCNIYREINQDFNEKEKINKKNIPQFISNKILLFIDHCIKELITNIMNLNKFLHDLNELNKKEFLSLEIYYKYKQYFYQMFIIIKGKYNINYKLFNLILEDLQKMKNYINELIQKENNMKIKNELNNYYYQIILIENEKKKINELFDIFFSYFEYFFKIFIRKYEESLHYIHYFNKIIQSYQKV